MWFSRRQHLERELRTQGEAYLGSPLDGSARLPPASYSVSHGPNGEPTTMPSNSPTAPIGLGVHEQFRPQRAPGSGLVLGGGAPGEVSSVYNRLRTQIMRRLQENHWNTVAITSPSRS